MAEARARSARMVHPLVWWLLLLFSLLQRPGETTFDTKFDLTADPSAFLGRTLHLWNPASSFGELQNQAYGYLFPQGSFFLLGAAIDLQPWVVQRLWSALLLVVAYEGARRLFGMLSPMAGPGAQVVAGLAYALAPRFLGLVGVLTGEVLPVAVLPWVALPLVAFRRGRLGPVPAALLSGVAVLAMGGVNATAIVATLPLPFLMVVASMRTEPGRRLALWWTLALALASAWWLLPLLLLGRYSPPFLDFIETAVATTRDLGWANVTRGADHWVGFVVVGGEPWWPGMYALSASELGVVVTALAASVGFAGLFRADMPWRGPLVGSALLGLLCLTIGHGTALGSPLAESVRSLLDGPLAPLRNVHKADPLVRLPLALGAGHLFSVLVAARRPDRWPGRLWRTGGILAVAATVALSAFPMVQGDLRKPGWREVPEAWLQAAAYVEEHQDAGRVLVLPGSGFGEQTWGSTIDEPIQGLASAPWVARTQVPLAPGPTIRWLTAVEERVSSGQGSPVLGHLLARSGVGLVLVRRDLRAGATDAPGAGRVDLALQRSGGLTRVARFGDPQRGPDALIDVYRVTEPVAEAAAVPVAEHAVLAGGVEDLLPALESGLVGVEQPVLFGAAPDVQGDGFRLVERLYGRTHDTESSVRTPDDPRRSPNARTDYPGVVGQEPVVLRHESVAAMDASSSLAFVDTVGPAQPQHGPYAAVDGLRETTWRTASWARPDRAWLELSLHEPQPIASVEIDTELGGLAVPVRTLRVVVGHQDRTVPVDPTTGRAKVRLDQSAADRIRVEVASTVPHAGPGIVGIREIRYPGMRTSSSLMLPEVESGPTSFVFSARPAVPACVPTSVGPSCNRFEARPGGAEHGLARSIFLDRTETFEVSGQVMSRATPSTRRLTEPLGPASVRVRSRSVLGDDPLVNPQNAYDADETTAWVAAEGDDSATLRLRWDEPVRLSRIAVLGTLGGARPDRVRVVAPGETRLVSLGHDGFGTFTPLRARRVRLTFSGPIEGAASNALAVAELRLDGLDGRRYSPDPRSASGAICGLGPDVRVDGRTIRTRVLGSLGDVETGGRLRLEGCGAPVLLSAGRHRVEVLPGGQFLPLGLTLAAVDAQRDPAPPRTRSVSTRVWSSDRRELDVGAGPEAVLRIPENPNDGWVATLAGERLRPVSVDGWQQGYVVPAGDGGTVTIRFEPGRTYRLALGVGAGLAALLLVLTALAVVRQRRRPGVDAVAAPGPRRRAGRGSRSAVVLGLGVLGGAGLAVGGLLGAWRGERPGVIALGAALVGAAGPLAVANRLLELGVPAAADIAAAVGVGVLAAAFAAGPAGEERTDDA